jgi:hypothetical protein
MYNMNMEQRPTVLFYVAVLLSQSQNVAWLSVKEFEDLNFFFVHPKVKQVYCCEW